MSLPSGTVTFVFTDVAGWTRLVQELRERAAEVVRDYEELLRSAFEERGGQVVDVAGDTLVAVFTRARDALEAVAEGQRQVTAHSWPPDREVRVAIGVHTGEANPESGRYVGLAPVRAARICAAAHGGQILVSPTTAGLAEDDLPPGLALRDLGPQSLSGFDRPVRLFQLLADGIPSEGPRLGRPRALPAGTVTFLFSDIEGSTRLTRQLRDAWADVLADQRRLLREAFEPAGGREVDSQGDGLFFVFGQARAAVAAAAEAQRKLAECRWPDDVEVRVRMGLHTGEPVLGEEGYVGLDVVRAARICAAGHGGQVLLSATTRALVPDDELEGVGVIDLGEHRLKDLPRPERVHQLVIAGLQTRFEPVRAGEPETQPPLPAVARQRDLAAHVEEAVRELRTSIEQSIADSLRTGGQTARPARAGRQLPSAAQAGMIFAGLFLALVAATLVLIVWLVAR